MATIEIDGKTFEVENGKMIIEVADEAGIHIPRFCYHKKLSVAANCRMCLVEIENSKKTVPACATPINHGMKVFTQSEMALKSQKIVMEFLLINHPLDCPICDQGGECELQDVSMGFGGDSSHYEETKRAVDDTKLGTLIATEMTRCIHCTRCVRFGEEIAGLREMGAPFRGEDVHIGTYVEKSLRSEISGNIIDLCPVGALTSKPYRYTARSWELEQYSSIAPHDCLGSNIHLHVRRGQLMRVVPRENEMINETWLSDRDRFSYTGNYSENRLAQPMIKQNGKWKTVDWSAALNYATAQLGEQLAHHGAKSAAALAHPSSTTEEMYLLQKWMRALKIANMDFRLKQNDYRLDQHGEAQIQNTLKYSEIENQQHVFLCGTQIHREVPLAAAKIRKASLNGAVVSSLNIARYEFPFDVAHEIIDEPLAFEQHLFAILAACKPNMKNIPESLKGLIEQAKVTSEHKTIATQLSQENAVIVTGLIFEAHPHYAVLRQAMTYIANATAAKWVHLTLGANANGAWAAGLVPHYGPKYQKLKKSGLHASEMLSKKLKVYVLNGIDPAYDFDNANIAMEAFRKAEFVLALSAFKSPELMEIADVILPTTTFAETSGTYINIDGTWQSFVGASKPFEQARPAWKVMRVLANLSHCEGFEFNSSQEILDELKAQPAGEIEVSMENFEFPTTSAETGRSLYMVNETPLYGTDMLVRESHALKNAGSADRLVIRVHSEVAKKLNLGNEATVTQHHNKLTLPVEIDDRLHPNVVVLPAVCSSVTGLGSCFSAVTIK
jgi:NADH-quinone oxidoreductase subunit G